MHTETYVPGDVVTVFDDETKEILQGRIDFLYNGEVPWYEIDFSDQMKAGCYHHSLVLGLVNFAYCYRCGERIRGESCPCDVETEMQRADRLGWR